MPGPSVLKEHGSSRQVRRRDRSLRFVEAPPDHCRNIDRRCLVPDQRYRDDYQDENSEGGGKFPAPPESFPNPGFRLDRRRRGRQAEQLSNRRRQPVKLGVACGTRPRREICGLKAPELKRSLDPVDECRDQLPLVGGLGRFRSYPVGADRGVRPQHDHATRRVQRFFDRIIERAAVLNLAVPPDRPAVTFEPVREKTRALAVRRRVADEDVRHGSHPAFVAPGAILRQEGEARRAVLRSAPRTTCGTSAASDTQTGSTVLRTTARDPSWRLAPAFR